MASNAVETVEVITASRKIPYSILREELEGYSSDFTQEQREINEYYDVYRKGSKFNVEGTHGDYVASMVRFKKAAQLVNRESRFLFGEEPTITIKPKGDLGEQSEEYKNVLTVYNDIVRTVLDANMFSKLLVLSSKDCFIGKRVACLLNFNESSGITISFFDSRRFIYECDQENRDTLVKLVCFTIVKRSTELKMCRIVKKKFTLENGIVYVDEVLYDGRGKEIEVLMNHEETPFKKIPGVVIINDGLLDDDNGTSEIASLMDYESVYSKMSNADIDAERKGMNQIKYAIDMDVDSTSNLSTSPGSFWDLQHNSQMDNPQPQVGTLQSSMEYSPALETTLKRVKSEMYDELEIPMIDIQNMSGIVTSGKAMKVVYWPLIVRCKEKMKTWGPKLRYIVESIIEGCIAYPNIAKMYTADSVGVIDYAVDVEMNFPLPEDEDEKKSMALQEVTAQVMSKKSYMKKWFDMTDADADAELEQIALERQMLEESYVEEQSLFGASRKAMTAEEEQIELDAEQEEMSEETI